MYSTKWTFNGRNGPRASRGCWTSLLAALIGAVCTCGETHGQTPGWSSISVIPGPRSLHALAYDPARARIILFGGYYFGTTDVFYGDTWAWDGAFWTLRSTTGPSPRYGHAMATDSGHGRIVLFGGYDGASYLHDTWEWDGATWTQRATTGPPGPPARAQHSMAYDSARGRVVLFGGYGGVSYLGDTWEWNGTSWTQVSMIGPARYRHAMAYDSSRSRTVLFGGFNDAECGDTWEWDGTAWAQRATTGPAPRYGHTMIYDAGLRRVVILGGFDGVEYLADTWEWNGIAWTHRAGISPTPRSSAALAYDPTRGRAALFAGTDGAYYLADTWELDSIRLGDLNVDTKVNALDIAPFITAVQANSTDTTKVYIADFNNSGAVDLGDVPGFVAALLTADP